MTKIPQIAGPYLVNETDVSRAWAKAVIHIIDHSGVEISPLILSVSGFDADGQVKESKVIRDSLDKLLSKHGHRSIADVAFTIFPQRIWKLAKGDRGALFKYYKDAFPRYKAMNRRDNSRGLYFERMIDFGRGPCEGNQLEWILSQYESRKSVRRSMFQVSVFDPERDHVASAQLQFPCLQHISFEPTKGGLVINAFYATQQMFVKAYGNYLGIAQLGAFVAREMKMNFVRMNVVIGVAKLERISKVDSDLSKLLNSARKIFAQDEHSDSAEVAVEDEIENQA